MKRKVLSYGFSGLTRTAISGASIGFGINMILSGTEQSSEGITNVIQVESSQLSDQARHLLAQICGHDVESAEPHTLEEIANDCALNIYKNSTVSPNLFAPGLVLALAGAYTLPKGLAYLKMAYHQATNHKLRTLTAKDFPPGKAVPPAPEVEP